MSRYVTPAVAAAVRRRSRLASLTRFVAMGFVLVELAGCAGAEVTDLAQAKVDSPPPTRVLVEVGAAPAVQEASEEQAAQEAASALQSDVIEQLGEVGIVAEPFVPGILPPSAVLLRVAVMKAHPGSGAGRLLLGFGVGRTKLQAKASLESADTVEARSIMSFSIVSDSGRMPGLVVPGGVALATANIVPLAVGGTIRVASSMRGGVDGTVRRTATALVDQLRSFYASAGWPWPADG